MGKPDGRPWIEIGTNTEVAYVFSCPGYEELLARRPAAKQTRANLDILIADLHDRNLSWIPTSDEATITNAWSRVEHTRSPGSTGRTQGEVEDVLQATNLDRLARELEEITDWVICFGDRAHWAVRALQAHDRLQARVAHVRHVTSRSLNHVKIALDGRKIKDLPEDERRNARLAVVAAELAAQFGAPDPAIDPYVIDGAETLVGTDQISLGRVVATVRKAFAGQPGFPQGYAHDASVGLAMVLEQLGIAAWTVRGWLHLDQAISLDDGKPETVHNEFFHWWVESCGCWIDLTYDQFRAGLDDAPLPVSIWQSGESSHHNAGVDDPSEANRQEAEMREGEHVRQVVAKVVKQWKKRAQQ